MFMIDLILSHPIIIGNVPLCSSPTEAVDKPGQIQIHVPACEDITCSVENQNAQKV